jgi:hypothetical protein
MSLNVGPGSVWRAAIGEHLVGGCSDRRCHVEGAVAVIVEGPCDVDGPWVSRGGSGRCAATRRPTTALTSTTWRTAKRSAIVASTGK